jgi:RNA polymerase sigma factor (sigma-70 family)
MNLFVQKSTRENELIEGCKRKHPKSQRDLYERFSGKMYSLCLRYIKEEAEAEDVLVGGFMKIFNKIEQYQKEGSFEGWIRKIMVNESLQYIRQNKNMYLQVNIENAQYSLNTEAIESQLAAEDLLKMVSQLPMGYRTIFNLYAIEGYSHQEIADMLDISVNTSKSQLSRARALLQKALSNVSGILKEKEISHEG